ncbi:hypothetical protein [Actinokineospora enzanensis]|uniref:hypothetical protein n=1 Tax=Actinokineospora enzanensis TaxID=155975 RepID=UPI00036D9A76|nr:hypothetical protein [Actinokineospora enzanensis]
MTVAGTTAALRPRYEGANIRTWIGFKHFLYLAEEAVLGWFRDRGDGPARLYHDCGVGLSVVDVSALLPAVLEVDDVVTAEVERISVDRFAVRLRAREGETVLRAKLRVALVRDHDRTAPVVPVPDDLTELVVDEVVADAPEAEEADYSWTWRIPYFHCQYSDRMQMSGYVRAVEEVVDRFLADRGISVGRFLTERGWIPVVSRASVRMFGDAHMEEEIRTSFTVTGILRDMVFDGRVDFDVHRDGEWVRVAQGQILHGYAISRGPDAGGVAELDPPTVVALLGRRA